MVGAHFLVIFSILVHLTVDIAKARGYKNAKVDTFVYYMDKVVSFVIFIFPFL
jgi:hypothetical protein